MAKFFTPAKLSDNIKTTPEGYLLCLNVPIARTGWQEYGPGETPLEVGEDGKVWIHREKEEVFRPQTIASFNAKSITVKHPDDFVVPQNWKELTVGIAQNIRRADEKDEDGEEMLLADLLITDEIAIGLVKNGLREVSCGYDAEYEETANGEGRQFNIIGNHIALVEQGRAGSAYAIKDHKGKVNPMTLKELAEKVKNLGKTVDEAVQAEDKKAEDLAKAKKKGKTADDDGTPEQVSYDEMMKHIKDMSEKLDGLVNKGKSGDDEEEEKKDDKEMADDEDPEMEEHEDKEVGQNSRLDKLEAAVAKILKQLGNKGEDDGDDDDDDMSGDEEYCDDDGYVTDDDEEGEEGEESQKKAKAGDAARIEILTPGEKFSGKDAKLKCLKQFAKTEDGAKVLRQLGLKKPVFDAKSNIDMLFSAAVAIVKAKRGNGLEGTKDGSKFKSEDDGEAKAPMTAEKMNEINAKHFGAK